MTLSAMKEATKMEILPADVVSRILESTPPYADDAQRDACERMVKELTQEEQEIAACTSYAYWVASQQDQVPSTQVRIKMAMREARRHLVGEANVYEKGLAALRASCQYRKDRHINVMRTLFDPSWSYSSDKDAQMATQYRSAIEQDLATQLMVVRGMDRDKRAIVIKFPRQSSGTQEAFIATQLYIAERAIATTEVLSLGKQEKVVCVFDFGTYSSSNAPPRSAITTTVHLLQRNYPERLDHLLILEAPFWMRALFTIIHPFLSADTKEKLIMIGDNKIKSDKIGSRISPENAMPFMMPDGKLTSQVDSNQFLRKVPFHALYDDVNAKDAKQAV